MSESLLSKQFKGILILNWKTGAMRVLRERKNKPKTSPWEIPIKVDIKVNLPGSKDIVAKGEVDIPEYKVKEMFVESI